MRSLHVLVGAAACALTSAAAARAQSCPNVDGGAYPKYGPLALRVPSSARMLAMGNANVAGRDDDVVFYSPAQLAIARGTSASVERFAPGTVAGAASTIVRIASGGIGLGMSAVQYEAPTCLSAPDLAHFASGGNLLGSSAQIAVGLAQTVKKFRVGVTGKYAAEQVPGGRYGSVLADVGVAHDVDWFDYAPFAAALSVQNLGADVHPDAANTVQAPLRATLGLTGGAPVGAFDVGVTTALSVRRDGFVAPAGGVELGYVWVEGYALVVRAGGRRPEEGLGAITAGAGLNADRFSLDYALETLSGARVAHRIGVRIR